MSEQIHIGHGVLRYCRTVIAVMASQAIVIPNLLRMFILMQNEIILIHFSFFSPYCFYTLCAACACALIYTYILVLYTLVVFYQMRILGWLPSAPPSTERRDIGMALNVARLCMLTVK